MGASKLCLLLLLSTSTLAFAQDEDQPTCLLNQRYKTLHKYEYQYQAESLNEINGASPLKNGPKASCTIEIEVPQSCSFILRTTGCSLSEVVDTDAKGNPVFAPASTADAFAAEMEKYPLKFVVDGVYDVKLYPEDGESTTILNFKRGIISALAVPLLEEGENRNMPTIHGKCKTSYQVNAREDIATDVTLNRYLSKCENFVPIRDYSSPLALISGMHYPLAQLFNSFQTCNYKFDNDKKHMTSGSCAEKHILIPFSHKGEYGVTSVGRQELTLVKVSPHNDRVFKHGDVVQGLQMRAVEDKSAVQDKAAFLKLLRDLSTLPESEGERRPRLFHQLVTMVSGMKADTLSPAIPEALAVSQALTYQVLAQCGTPECSSAIMQILRTFDIFSVKIDATVFALGLVSNPSALLINDMLEMAKYKPSKPIMYALSNVVKRFYNVERKVIPEIHSVAEFMAARLGDCSGSDINNFMTLRVVGNMAPAVMPASPALRSAVIQCVNQPAASLAVQQAAIQAYRLVTVPEKDREILIQVLLDHTSSTQKRIAAYLILMKDPQPSELVKLNDALSSEQDVQVKSFVVSHINNILASTEPDTQELRQRIRDALQGNDIGPIMDRTKFSNNYKIGYVEGNMLFEGSSFLPKEVMLEMTLKAFGYDIDMMEIGMAGTGLEPTVDALFGENGFFPDTVLKTVYFVSDNMPRSVSEILQDMLPALKKDRMKRQAATNLVEEIELNFNKLVNELKASQSPEAMVYLKLLGNELGYLSTNEMEGMTFSAAMMIQNMLKMFPSDLMAALVTKNDNTIFGHYIFMDNEFFLPTLTGVPLRVALSGTFTPGIKGGLKFRDMREVAFLPSAGVEFVTHIGSHLPEYVNSGLEMHSNIFHESGLSVKISVNHDQVKLTIPAPASPIKLIKITNSLVAVTNAEVKTIPSSATDKVDVDECTPVFTGMKYCSALQYNDASSQGTSPYFPLTGDSKFALELHPTGEVTEYTATVAYELLKEGEEGRLKVDSVKFILRAEGADPTEARAILKYNRKKTLITADIQIPDYDVEAGFRLGVDGKSKGKTTHSISLDILNKNIPQLSLVGRANLKAMKEGMLQGQLIVPSINTDATVTANMRYEQELELELKSEVKLMDATSEQKIALRYSGEKIEVAFNSDVNTKTANLPGAEVLAIYGNDLLDTQVGQTDMKVGHIFKMFSEAANNYMEKYGDNIPYMKDIRIPEIPGISVPDTLFLNTEAKAAFYFNNKYFTFAIPVPLGGKSTEDLNFPPTLATPRLSLPQFGLDIPSVDIPIPELEVPERITMSLPLLGKAELSALMRSNLYNMKASVAVEEDAPNYSAKLNVKGTSPLDILSVEIDGLGAVIISDSIMASLKTSLVHEFIKVSISIEEEASFTDKINLRSSSEIEAMSSLGVSFEIKHTGTTGINSEDISADNMFKGMFRVGPMYANTTSAQSFTIFPFRPEAKIDATVEFDSTIVKAQNSISATLSNGELSVLSNTKAFQDSLTHVAEFSFKDRQVSLKCDSNALVLGVKIQKQTEASAGVSGVTMKVETNMELSENRGYTLLTASLDGNGLAVNNNAMLRLFENQLTHKASLKFNNNGLTTSGTTSVKSPLSLENTFEAGVDFSKATLSITNRAALSGININNANTLTVTPSTLDFKSKAHATGSEYASYTHDITLGLKPYSASANINNNMNLLSANIKNEAKLEAELLKFGVIGSLTATYGHEEIKHTYELKYAEMTANAKFNTIGKVFGAHMNHNTELDIYGLAATITNDLRFNSQPMRFDHSIRGSVVPFDINLDALFNANGEIIKYGKHNAQLYGKYNLKAQPLAIVSMHECRASVTNTLDNDLSLETTFDTKAGIVLTPQEQQTRYTMTSKMNEHAFNQGLTLYNSAEKTGIEIVGTIFTNLFNADSPENQEFTISAFVKYDKSTDSHVIQLPLVENVPVLLESIKGYVVPVAESLQDYMKSCQLNVVLDDIHRVLVFLESRIKDNVIQLKQRFSDFMQESISFEDLEASLRNLKKSFENILFGLMWGLGNWMMYIDKAMSSNAFTKEVRQQLLALEREYKISQFINHNFEMIIPCIEEIFKLFPEELLNDPVKYIMVVVKDVDIPNRLNILRAKIKELIVKLDADEIIQAFLEKLGELFQQLKIEKTIEAVLQIVKDLEIQNKLMQVIEAGIANLKSIDVNLIIKQLNFLIEIVESVNLLNYNEFVNFTNLIIHECAAYVNHMIRSLEIPQKLEATKDFVNFIISSTGRFMEHLKKVKIAEIIKSFQDIFDEGLVNNVKTWAKFIKHKIKNQNFKDVITKYLNMFRKCYVTIITIMTQKFTSTVKTIETIAPNLKITSEIQQIIAGLSKELMKGELFVPSLPIPFTDLVLPSVVFRIDDFEIPAQLDIPEFTILGTYTVKATTISLDDIKQKITELIDFIINLEIKVLDADALFGDVTLNFLPTIPEISFPEFTFPEMSFPNIPNVPLEKLVKSLELSKIKLPTIPHEITVSSFGKLYGEIKLLTPTYTMETSGELQNPTKNKLTPELTGFLNSYATSKHFEILNYELNSTARISVPKMSRIVLAETVKFNHVAFKIDHQAFVALYGLPSAQAQAKTEVKVKTTPYTAKYANTASIAIGGGISASFDTGYNHLLYLPWSSVKSEASVTQKIVAKQDGPSFTLTVDNSCEGKINDDDSNHKSKLQLSVTPSAVGLTFSGDTDIVGLRVKQHITAESGTFSYFKFNVRNEAEAPVFKNSLFVASGQGNLYDMTVELKANHNTELKGEGKGFISNTFNLVARPFEFVYEFHNKGTFTLGTLRSLPANIDLQKDYSIILRPDSQLIATVTLFRLNQYKTFYNFTFSNNEKEAGIFAAMENADLFYFLSFAVVSPELENLLTTTEQTVAVDAKLVFQKSRPLEIMGLVQIPNMVNMISELSVKTDFINLNVNAGLYPEDNLVFRLGATTASVFESLNAKLQVTTSLTTKRGIKLANSLSFENPHINGSHDSTISASSERDVSLKSTTRANMAGTIDTDYLVLGVLDNEVNVYLNNDGLQSTSKVITDVKVNHGTTRVISLDLNKNLAIEASLSHVYVVLSYINNNEAKLFNFHTKGKHNAKATMNVATSSLSTDIEIDILQPSNMGDISISEKTVAKVTVPKQKMSTTARFSSPLYTANLEADLEGQGPVFKGTFKSSGNSDNMFPAYDIKASTTTNYENQALSMISKVAVTGLNLTMNVDHVITKVLSVSRHTLRVDFSIPTVTVANFDYAAGRDGINASVSTPVTGFVGLQLNGPSQLSARVYHRSPSAPEVDVDILVVKSSPVDVDKMNLQIVYYTEAYNAMEDEMWIRFDPILSIYGNFENELLSALAKRLAEVIDPTVSALSAETEVYYNSFVEDFSAIEIQLSSGDVITGDQIWKPISAAFNTTYKELIDFLNSANIPNELFWKMFSVIAAPFNYCETIKYDYEDAVTSDINALYEKLFPDMKIRVDQVGAQCCKLLKYAYDILDYVYNQYWIIEQLITDLQIQVLENTEPYVDYSDTKFEINLTFPFQQ
ncbi:apolipoprotein Bb, tandem duplicate 1 isoform X2 [Betta splendens]|uniref:Apolipoprotein Bb, tandem duplicate 1 isoform X2 n=1 Tax=Betta splendens TaxID=158456 RepID=A0A9W2XK29_BETSP|nr:apolipoprotein Bb, tandem duplicate 1 isoform X2 [Betta splendens]